MKRLKKRWLSVVSDMGCDQWGVLLSGLLEAAGLMTVTGRVKNLGRSGGSDDGGQSLGSKLDPQFDPISDHVSGARAYLFSDTHFQELTAFRRLSRHLFRLGSGDRLNQPALLD